MLFDKDIKLNIDSEGSPFLNVVGTEGDDGVTDIKQVKTDDELAQANVDILEELYADENSVTNLLTENDNTVISEIDDSVFTADDINNTSDQIDIQVMILTENMAAFPNESNISESIDMQNNAIVNQLLVSTQV